jgi:nicotinamide phosphoribosyltransferase
MNNIIIQSDSYKIGGHWNMYPDGTEFVNSYFESRNGAKFTKTPFFGLQAKLKKYFVGQVVTREKIERAAALCKAHFGSDAFFNRKGWEYILNAHGGKLPLRIKAVPEGTPVTVSNILMNVENTDPKTPWLTNYVESILTHVWYPSTVAALSRACKEMFAKYYAETADNANGINFMLHDFGYRGVSSDESAAFGGAAHLINFLGTDTVPAMEFAMEYYNAPLEGLAYSVAATEHSVMTARGPRGEEEILDALLLKYPTGIFSCVADSFDIYNFVENIVCKKFKDRILNRDGLFVIRPDSTTPIHKTPEEQMVWIAQTVANNMGYTVNTKGYMVLNPKVKILWGDGIDKDGIEKILIALKEAGFSIDCIATFGMGGGLLQKVNRDTQRFAFKSSAQCRNGVWHDIYKQPKDLSKASKRGRLKLIYDTDGNDKTVTIDDPMWKGSPDRLEVVFENGELKREYTFAQVRDNAKL